MTDLASLLEELVRRHGALHLKMALRVFKDEDRARDGLQEGYRKFLTCSSVPRDPEEAGKYLCRLLSNQFIDNLRKEFVIQRRQAGGSVEIEQAVDRRGGEPESRFMRAERGAFKSKALEKLAARLETLPPLQRQLIHCLFFKEPPMTLMEISRARQIPVSTVHSRLQSALHVLRGLCADLQEEWEKS